jgi:hypothetical protein
VFRGCRFIILAIAGLTLIGSGKVPQPPAKTEKQQTERTVEQTKSAAETDAAKPTKAVEPSEYYQPCGQRGSEGNSDLCAQWSAAKAASDAAKWAWWQLWLSGLGVLGLGITLWFNFKALKLAEGASEETKGALAIAERNADAAVKLADQAEVNAERQLRGYVSVTTSIFIHYTDELERPFIQFSIKNHGQTPVHIVSCNVGITWFCDKDNVAELFGENDRELGFDLFPGDPVILPFGLTAESELLERDGLIMVVGRIDYRDVFEADDFTGFMFKSAKASDLFDVEHGAVLSVMPYPHGNKRKANKK